MASTTPPPSPRTTVGHPLLYDEYAAVTQQYKSKYGNDTIVLMEVGSFLEFYDCDRGLGADVPRVCATLGVQATRKNKSIPQVSRTNPAFGGVPRVAMAKYVPMLVEAGFSVVLYMQQQQQQQDDVATSKGGGGNLKRAVTEVISQATLGATACLDPPPNSAAANSAAAAAYRESSSSTLMAVHIERGANWSAAGWALVDLSTGRTSAGECTSSDPKDLLRPLDALRRVTNDACPVESIVGIVNVVESGLSIEDVCAHLGLARRTVRDAGKPDTRPTFQNAVLSRAFPKTGILTPAEFCDLERKPFALSALVMATQYAYEHSETIVSRIQPPKSAPREDGDCDDDGEHSWFIDMSADAMRQLDVSDGNNNSSSSSSRSAMAADPTDTAAASLVRLLNRCKTPVGRRAFRERLLSPSRNPCTIGRRLDAVEAMLSLDSVTYNAIRADLERVGDLERAFRRVCLRRANACDLASLSDQLDAAAEALLKASGPGPSAAAVACRAARNAIVSRIDVDKAASSESAVSFFVRGAHASIDDAQDELDSARAVFHSAAAALNSEMKSEHVKVEYGDAASGVHLSITFRRWTAAVQSGAVERASVEPWFRGSDATIGGEGSSSSSSNRKILHPALGPAAADRVSRSQGALTSELTVRLRELLDELADAHAESLWNAVRSIEDLDVAWTGAKNATDFRLARPRFAAAADGTSRTTTTPVYFRSKALRHPIVEALLERRTPGTTPTPYVPNDVSLGCDGVAGMLLYGVNAVGKSSIMKAVGIAVVMAQSGMFVAADSLEIGPRPFSGIFTRVGLRDDLTRGHSTFVVEMLELRAILRRASPGSLVIGDELCAGTEAPSALAIVGAGIAALADRGTPFVFATHLHELVDLPQIADLKGVKAMHLSARHDEANGRLVLDRRLSPGTGPPTYGLEVCRSLDMDPAFLRAADSIRRHVLGEHGGLKTSRYNRRVLVDRCGVCGEPAEETHHIEPQATPESERKGGVHRRSNLVPLCGKCHDATHRGELSIGGYVATTEGAVLSFTSSSPG